MKGLKTLKKIGKAAIVFAIGIAGTLVTDKCSDTLVGFAKNHGNDDDEFDDDVIEVETEEETEEESVEETEN